MNDPKNILILFPNFDLDSFFLREDKSLWRVISIHDLVKWSKKNILSLLYDRHIQILAIGRDEMRKKESKFFIEAFVYFSRARTSYVVNNNFQKKYINHIYFWLQLLPRLLVEILISCLILFFTWLVSGFFYMVLMVKKNTKAIINNDNRLVFFLRTDFFGTLNVGGSFTHVQGVRVGLLRLGHHIKIFASNKPGSFSEVETPFHEIPYFGSCNIYNIPEMPDIIYNWRFILRMFSHIQRDRPSFIYQRHSAFNIAGVVLGYLFKIPVILEVNNLEVWLKAKWGKLFFRRLCAFMEKIAFAGATSITVVSDVLKKDLIAFGVDEKKIVVVPNGVDETVFSPEVDGMEIRNKYKINGKKVVGFIGSFGVWHGVEILAHSVRRIIDVVPDTHFLIMGDGTLRHRVEEILQNDKVLEYVTLTGSIPHTHVPAYLSACDMFVSPHVPNADGTDFFGSPTKLFEYMAMGKPIVASNLGQIGQVLHHKKNAYLTIPGDLDSFSQGVIDILSDMREYMTLGEHARQDVLREYNWTAHVEKIILFTKLMSR